MSGVKKANGHRLEGILPIAEPPMQGPHPTADDVEFDLDATLAAVRPLRSTVPPDCHSAATLGTEREGSAVLIDESGLLLTIGYLIVEATDVAIGRAVDSTRVRRRTKSELGERPIRVGRWARFGDLE